MEKSSPQSPLQKPFIAFSPFGDKSPNNEKVVRVLKEIREESFQKNSHNQHITSDSFSNNFL